MFALPRELRDKIYYYYMYRGGRLYYIYHPDRHFEPSIGKSEEIQNLLVVSKRVYAEVIKMMYLANTVILHKSDNRRQERVKPLPGLLRLFPDSVAENLTRVGHKYSDVVGKPWSRWGYRPRDYIKQNSSGQTFVEILLDAHLFKEYFPRLVLFEAGWYPEPPSAEHPQARGEVHWIAKALKEGTDESEIVAKWLVIMRRWLQGHGVVPLSCIEFWFDGYSADGFTAELDLLANEAYRKLVKERPPDDIEDSGRLWLEELEKDETTRRKKGRKKK